jgi:hypothetical protein
MRQVHDCACAACQQATDGAVVAHHRAINVVLSRLDEQQRRWSAAVEAQRLGHGGTQLLAQITGLDVQTIRRGRRELATDLADRPVDRVRLPGGGRKPIEKKMRAS